jgi:hypothetical protein
VIEGGVVGVALNEGIEDRVVSDEHARARCPARLHARANQRRGRRGHGHNERERCQLLRRRRARIAAEDDHDAH